MKQEEQGVAEWTTDLITKLHKYYVFIANVNLRKKVENDGFTRIERRRTLNEMLDRMSEKANEGERLIYCQEFNKKTCLQSDHHEGRFMNRKMTKWHLCSKCLNKEAIWLYAELFWGI